MPSGWSWLQALQTNELPMGGGGPPIDAERGIATSAVACCTLAALRARNAGDQRVVQRWQRTSGRPAGRYRYRYTAPVGIADGTAVPRYSSSILNLHIVWLKLLIRQLRTLY
eukprot:SAG31_NODE_115_length_24128_cov_47.693912_7_plen_112_part_00